MKKIPAKMLQELLTVSKVWQHVYEYNKSEYKLLKVCIYSNDNNR